MSPCAEHDAESALPSALPPNGLINLASQARRVVDADEEVFILYTLYSAPAGRIGLGSVDSQNDFLSVSFELDDDDFPQVQIGSSASSKPSVKGKARNEAARKRISASRVAHKGTTVRFTIHQDSTSLRSTDGDTGSVVWRSSLRLGACLARQVLHKPPYGHPSLLNKNRLAGVKVLELGSGTGVLSTLLVPLFDHLGPLMWIASDHEEILSLLRKNTSHVAKGLSSIVEARAVDWNTVSDLQKTPSTYSGGLDSYRARVLSVGGDAGFPDLIVAVDCVFNPSLFEPLINTLDAFTLPAHTVVLVVIELRSSDTTMVFLETWLCRVTSKWQIWAVPPEQLSCGLNAGYAAWVGWKT